MNPVYSISSLVEMLELLDLLDCFFIFYQAHIPVTHPLSYSWNCDDGGIWINLFGTLQGIKFDASRRSLPGNYLLSVGLCQKITQALFSITQIYPEYFKILFKVFQKSFSKYYLETLCRKACSETQCLFLWNEEIISPKRVLKME